MHELKARLEAILARLVKLREDNAKWLEEQV
jgi:hypothetical protein